MIVQIALIGSEGAGRVDPDLSARLSAAFGCPFPLALEADSSLPTLWIDAELWHCPEIDLLEVDRMVHEREDLGVPFCLGLRGIDDQDESTIIQVLTRYQRLLPYPDPTPIDLRLLSCHRQLFDLTKPLVRADYDHALDTWRWLIRLEPRSGISLQLAALYHDIERLWTEAEVRTEQHAADYLAFKRRHARRGAEHVVAELSELGLPSSAVRRVAELVGQHEEPLADPDLALLNDADGLSFFSLNSWGFYRYFGAEHTRKKVVFTLRRMRTRARRELPKLRQHPAVAECLQFATEDQT